MDLLNVYAHSVRSNDLFSCVHLISASNVLTWNLVAVKHGELATLTYHSILREVLTGIDLIRLFCSV